MNRIKLLAIVLSFLSSHLAYANTNTLVHCLEGSPTNFNLQHASDATSMDALANTVYNRLLKNDYNDSSIKGDLAESWTVSKNGKVYNFKLRKNVSFHANKLFKPSRKLNADDVIYTFKRVLNKEHPYHKVGGGKYPIYFAHKLDKIIKDVKKINDYEVEFTLNEPNAVFLSFLTHPGKSILSAEYAKTLTALNKKENMNQFPIGTGPYVFKKYKVDSEIRFAAHDNYFGTQANIAKLVIRIVPHPNIRVQKLKVGECHTIALPPPNDYAALKANKKISTALVPGLNIGYLGMNVEKTPLNHLKVRQAISLTVNRQRMMDPIFSNLAEVPSSALPSKSIAHKAVLKNLKPNLAKAKKLMREAGYPNGFNTKLWTIPVSRTYNPDGKKSGEMIQEDLKKIGINAKLVSFDWGTYLSKSRKGEHDLVLLGWNSSSIDPEFFLGMLLSCETIAAGVNRARWCSKKYSQLVNQAKRETNAKKRVKLYQAAQKIFAEQMPFLPLATGKIIFAYRAELEKLQTNPIGRLEFASIKFKESLHLSKK